MEAFEQAIKALIGGVKRVDFDWNGCEVVAYWTGTVLRIDIKGLR